MVIKANNNKEKELLEIIYQYLSKEKCIDLDLSCLKGIIVGYAGKLDEGVGARYENNWLYINENGLNSALNNICIENFYDYVYRNKSFMIDEKTKLLIDNIMHELFHCDAQKKMPILHTINVSEDEDIWKRCISHFWIECTVEYISRKNSFLKKETLLLDISKTKWNIKYFFGSNNQCENMYNLIYTTSYFIALNLVFNTENKYIKNVTCLEIKELYYKLFVKCKELFEQHIYIDDYNKIKDIEVIFRNYFNSLHLKKFWFG